MREGIDKTSRGQRPRHLALHAAQPGHRKANPPTCLGEPQQSATKIYTETRSATGKEERLAYREVDINLPGESWSRVMSQARNDTPSDVGGGVYPFCPLWVPYCWGPFPFPELILNYLTAVVIPPCHGWCTVLLFRGHADTKVRELCRRNRD